MKGTHELGIINSSGDRLGIDDVDFTRGVLLTGSTGSGKTYEILSVANKILSIPIEQREFSVLCIQRIKHDFDPLAKAHPDFGILDWKDLRYNMWQVEPWDDPLEKLKSACTIFSGENYLFTQTGPILRWAVRKAYKQNKVFDGSTEFPTFSDIRNYVNQYSDAENLRGNDTLNAVSNLGNRLTEFKEEGHILNAKIGFTTDIFLNNDICLNVMDESEYVVRTTIMNILYDIQRFLQKHQNEKPSGGMRILVIIDEASWLFETSRDNQHLPGNRILQSWFTAVVNQVLDVSLPHMRLTRYHLLSLRTAPTQ